MTRYLIALLITCIIFITVVAVSIRLNTARVTEVRDIGDSVAIDILSLETQFDLLAEMSCESVKENSSLSRELSALGGRLSFAEETLGRTHEQVIKLKRQYFLLEIKDWLLMKRIAQKCGLKPVFITYYYGNPDECPDCERQGIVLTELAKDRPDVRVYSFDYNSDVAAVRTLIRLHGATSALPALSVRDKLYTGLQNLTELTALLPKAPATTTKLLK
jgi:thiol-disulfide isomerase/thioredoxin